MPKKSSKAEAYRDLRSNKAHKIRDDEDVDMSEIPQMFIDSGIIQIPVEEIRDHVIILVLLLLCQLLNIV